MTMSGWADFLAAKGLGAEAAGKAAIETGKEYLSLFPEDAEARAFVLDAMVVGFREAFRLWPEGVLHEGGLADIAHCQKMKGNLKACRAWDEQGRHADFLNLVETRLNIQIGQLRSDEGKCFF